MENAEFLKLVQTNIRPAYWRAKAGILFACEIWEAAVETAGVTEAEVLEKGVPLQDYEQRHKMINEVIDEEGITQFLEIASGLSPRGLDLCVRDKNVVYVELDLPESVAAKEKILTHFCKVPNNLHLVGGNGLRQEDIERCEEFFDKTKPVAVIAEGFIGYLTREEQDELARRVRGVLENFGGIWINNFSRNANEPYKTAMTGRNKADFEGDEKIAEYFSRNGLKHSFHTTESEHQRVAKIVLDK
jgi:O-methyltransferase involved in polyketide biosynthesis